jgi:hypothetical protein
VPDGDTTPESPTDAPADPQAGAQSESPDHPAPPGAGPADELAAAAAGPADRPAGRSRAADDRPLLPDVTADERDVGWGDPYERDDDERFLREVPPHHGT